MNRNQVFEPFILQAGLASLQALMSATLFPGSMITVAGIYLISHSTGHRPDAQCELMQGLLLPACPDCSVSYSPVEAAKQVGHDTQESKTEPYFDRATNDEEARRRNNQAQRDNAANQSASAKQMRDNSDTMRRKDAERRSLAAAKQEMSKPRVAKSAR